MLFSVNKGKPLNRWCMWLWKCSSTLWLTKTKMKQIEFYINESLYASCTGQLKLFALNICTLNVVQFGQNLMINHAALYDWCSNLQRCLFHLPKHRIVLLNRVLDCIGRTSLGCLENMLAIRLAPINTSTHSYAFCMVYLGNELMGVWKYRIKNWVSAFC